MKNVDITKNKYCDEGNTFVTEVPFDSDKLKNENFLIEVGTIRKKALIDVGGYDDREKHSHEDWRLWLQLLSKGYYPVHLGYYGAWYRRINDGSFSITANDQTNSERAYAKIKEVADTIQGRIEAIEYPLRKTDRPYHQPEMIKFDLFHNHESKKIKNEIFSVMYDCLVSDSMPR